MRTADLYIRVSTDEQADKGFSQRDQEERLRRYCDINGIQVRKVMFEDHSAKTFNRPQWQRYLTELKKLKSKGAQLVLFTKWDRFSRNAADAYQMIAILSNLSLEPQAIEQPLNMEIPESKIMLAVYLATPEVENDRRALNVTHGMRWARKEGRYLGRAPLGYINKSREDGFKYVAIHPEEGKFMKWIFEKIAEGVFVPDQIRKLANEQGFQVTRANFHRLIRNPIYCGKVVVKAYRDEPEQWVNGQHEPLITEALFYKVQDILEGRKRAIRAIAVKVNEGLPLQGFINCAMCQRQLTGSASKERRGGFYYYYHAQAGYGCGCRYRADDINMAVINELRKFMPVKGMNALYKQVLLDVYREYRDNAGDERRSVNQQIAILNAKVAAARELLFDEKLDPEDFCNHEKGGGGEGAQIGSYPGDRGNGKDFEHAKY